MTEQEFGEFFKSNWRGHLYFAQKMLPGDLMAAEDAVGVAYMQAWEWLKIVGVRDNGVCLWGATSSYIRKAIYGKVLDYTKHLRRGREVKQHISYLSKEYIESIENKSELLNSLLAGLSKGQRKALELYINGFSYEDMSIALKVTVNTARTQIKRGLDKIRMKIGYVKPARIGACRDSGQKEQDFARNKGKRINPYSI